MGNLCHEQDTYKFWQIKGVKKKCNIERVPSPYLHIWCPYVYSSLSRFFFIHLLILGSIDQLNLLSVSAQIAIHLYLQIKPSTFFLCKRKNLIIFSFWSLTSHRYWTDSDSCILEKFQELSSAGRVIAKFLNVGTYFGGLLGPEKNYFGMKKIPKKYTGLLTYI